MEAPVPAKELHPVDVAAGKLQELLRLRLGDDGKPRWTGQDGFEYSVALPRELSPGRTSSLMVLRSNAPDLQLAVAAWAVHGSTYVSAARTTPRVELERMFPHPPYATPGASPSLSDRLLSLSSEPAPWGPDVKLNEEEVTLALDGLVAYVERSLLRQQA